MSTTPRRWWINERTGSSSSAEESIDHGYHTEVLEAAPIEARLRDAQAEIAELKERLEVANNSCNMAIELYQTAKDSGAYLKEKLRLAVNRMDWILAVAVQGDIEPVTAEGNQAMKELSQALAQIRGEFIER